MPLFPQENRSEERRVGKECSVTRVDLGGRRIIQAEDGIRDTCRRDWSSDVCSSDLPPPLWSHKTNYAQFHLVNLQSLPLFLFRLYPSRCCIDFQSSFSPLKLL